MRAHPILRNCHWKQVVPATSLCYCILTIENIFNQLHAKLLQSCPTLCTPMDCSLPGFSVHRILEAGILGWVAISEKITFPLFHKHFLSVCNVKITLPEVRRCKKKKKWSLSSRDICVMVQTNRLKIECATDWRWRMYHQFPKHKGDIFKFCLVTSRKTSSSFSSKNICKGHISQQGWRSPEKRY